MTITNLYTGGNEFKLPNGKFYSGPYHIHPSKGAMVGANHVSTPHSFLAPATAEAKDKVDGFLSRSKRLPNNISRNMSAPTTPRSRPRPSAPAPRPRRQPRSAPPPASNVQRRTTGYSSY